MERKHTERIHSAAGKREINVGIIVENVCHPLQAEEHMAGQVGGRNVTWHRYCVPQPLSKVTGCQTSVQLHGPNVLSL